MSEDNLQQQIVVWFRNNYQIQGKGSIFSVPNGGSRNVVEAKKLKATGLLAGVSDLIVLLPDAKCLFIELKTETGVQSDKQKDFENVVSTLGFDYYIVRTLSQFKIIINNALML